MATRQSEAAALADRCRKVGWEVIHGAKGWKIYDPNRTMFTIHKTSSDVQGLNITRAQIEKAGLTEAEEQLTRQRTAATRAKLDADRRKAEAEADAAEQRARDAANNGRLAKAAGPYLVDCEDVELSWYTTPHPAPWMRWCNVTPAIAAAILENHNGDNRALAEASVTWYRNIILGRLWRLTHQGLAFDARGLLQDGQHRLAALCEAAELDEDITSVPFLVAVGMPKENFKVIDEGRVRTAGQLFGKDGEKNTSALQSCVRLVRAYANGDTDARKAVRLRLPNQVIVDDFAATPDLFREAATVGASVGRKTKSSLGSMAAAYYLLVKHNGKNEYVQQFFDGLSTGCYPGTRHILDDEDPRAVYRNRMATIMASQMKPRAQRERIPSPLTQLGMVLTTWNNCAAGRHPRALKFGEDSAIPKITICHPGTGVAPAAFRKIN